MKNLFKKPKTIFFYLFLILFSFTLIKIDYFFVSEINCCSDEFDYFVHAQTIVEDFDFDYSNQILNIENARFNNNNKIAPAGFIGSSLLRVPFYYIGNFLKQIFNQNGVFNYLIVFYSYSSIFYFGLTYLLLYKSIQIINKDIKNFRYTIIFFGSGISYYAFERFGMTHVIEVFINSMIIFITLKFSNSYNKKLINFYASIIPFLIMLGILTRWTNYYILVLPFLINYISKIKLSNSKPLFKNVFFQISCLFSLTLFLILSKFVYGIITFNPQKIYSTENVLGEFIELNFNFLFKTLKNFLLIFYTNEFGILWTSSSIAIAFILILFNLLRKKNILFDFFNLIIFLQIFGVVLLWETTASSYGFRYLFSLIPYSIFYIFTFSNFNKKFNITNLVFWLSIVGFLCVVFFETTIATQLNTELVTNSFGKKDVRYSQPKYLSGVFESLIQKEAYVKIFANSFLFAVLIKIITFTPFLSNIYNFFEIYQVQNYENEFNKLLATINSIQIQNLFIFILLVITTLYFVLRNLNISNLKNSIKKKNYK